MYTTYVGRNSRATAKAEQQIGEGQLGRRLPEWQARQQTRRLEPSGGLFVGSLVSMVGLADEAPVGAPRQGGAAGFAAALRAAERAAPGDAVGGALVAGPPRVGDEAPGLAGVRGAGVGARESERRAVAAAAPPQVRGA